MEWCVYKHISPSNKVYIGISSNVKRRWAANGYYYHLSDTAFSRALKKYGWDNFKHEIIVDNLTEYQAKCLEIELISLYKKLGISYNTTNGGDGYKGPHSISHIKNRIESRISNNLSIVLVIDKNFEYLVFRSKSEAGLYLGVTTNVISHVLLGPLGYTCKGHYLYELSKDLPTDITCIKDEILNAISYRKELDRLRKLKNNK